MKKENLILTFFIIVFCGTAFWTFGGANLFDSKSKNNSENIVYSDEYKESVRQNVIYELYGSREEYANEKTGSRSDYVDKEASKDGELVIDENRMQQVYDSKLKEFDSMIDNEKVDKIVNERLMQTVGEGTYNEVGVSNEVTSKKVMYWENGGKYFALVIELGMILCLIYMKRKNKLS